MHVPNSDLFLYLFIGTTDFSIFRALGIIFLLTHAKHAEKRISLLYVNTKYNRKKSLR